MSYALETKKRKFDRILESLSDNSASQSRTSLNSRNNQPSDFTETLLDASKRRKVTPILKKANSQLSLSGHYLPSSRTAFLDRLETYRHVTRWHISSTGPVNAVAWAKRGWNCVDTDTVSCGSCKERVTVNLDVEEDKQATDDKENDRSDEEQRADGNAEDAEDITAMFYEGLVNRYAEMITTSHADNCPWKKRGCDSSIQRIEGLLNSITAVASMRDRYSSITENLEQIPSVSTLPQTGAIPIDEEELKAFESETSSESALDILKLAMCGWQRKDDDVVECKHCFRSLGLWLYRGTSPSIEHLDAVEGHLEYCPWRSAHAQDTAIPLNSNESDEIERKTPLPGWCLMYLALVKQNTRRRGHTKTRSFPGNTHDTDASSLEKVSPEQREKRMKDLMRRIREIKKPFNVKSLLKKKDKSTV